MSSQVTHKQSSNKHPLAYILGTCALIFSSWGIFTVLSQPPHGTASHPSPGDNHQSTGGRSEGTQGQVKWPRETHSVIHTPGLSTLPYLSRIVAQPPPSIHPA